MPDVNLASYPMIVASAGNILTPSRHQTVPLGITAFIMYAALTEGEFVLRVYDLRRSLPVRPVDATRPHHAIPDNLLVLLRGDRAPDFVRQLFTDYGVVPICRFARPRVP